MTPQTGIIAKVEAYIGRYVIFPDPMYRFAAALWVVGTFLWRHFDAFPYLTITSETKRSGKTRLSEVLGFVAHNPRAFAGMTAAGMLRSIRDEEPTVIVDEAESLSSEAATMLRTVLNIGYRRGQTIPRAASGGEGLVEWPAYCPKVFVLIGDVYDTLRDRSIIVRMRRSLDQTPQRFVYQRAKDEGDDIRNALLATLDDTGEDGTASVRQRIVDTYTDVDARLPYLNDRDEEIWLPLYAIARVLSPDRAEEFARMATDMATEKTVETKRHGDLHAAEDEANRDEYARRLLVDVLTVMGNRTKMHTGPLLEALHALPTSPWRKFRGEGLNAYTMADLLARFKVKPTTVTIGGRKNRKVRKGYQRKPVQQAAEANSLL